MKFLCLTVLAVASSSAVEENVALQSRVVMMQNEEIDSDSKLTHLSPDSDGKHVKKQKQLEVLLEQSSHFELAVKKRIAGQEVSSFSAELVKTVKKTGKQVMLALITDTAVQQGQATDSNAAIEDANDALNHDVTGASGVDELRGIMQIARTAHETCRKNQLELRSDRDEKCQAYEDYAKKTHDNRPQCQCDNCVTTGGDPPDADVITSCFKLSDAWVAEREAKLLAKQAKCVNAKRAYQSRMTRCNRLQVAFEASYCAYGNKFKDACETFTTALNCPPGLENQRTLLLASLRKSEAVNKATYVATKQLVCLVTLYEVPANCTPEALTACHNAEYSTSHLDITYPSLLDPASCDASSVDDLPGSDAWKDAEYCTPPAWAALVQDVTCCAAHQ